MTAPVPGRRSARGPIQPILDWFRSVRAGIAIGAALGAGVLLWLGGTLADDAAAARFSSDWWLMRAGELGQLLLVSGLIGAFLRVFQASGLFTRAVAEVMTTDAFLDHVTDLDGLNVRLTRRLYLGDSLDAIPDRAIREQIEQDVEKAFAPARYTAAFAAEVHSRTLIVDWLDQDRTRLRVSDETDVRLTPLRPDARLQGHFRPPDGVPLTRYRRDPSHFKINGQEVDPARISTVVRDDMIEWSYPAGGVSPFHLTRKVEKVIDPALDPVIIYRMPYLVRKANVKVQCDAVGVHVDFYPINAGHIFHDERSPELRERKPGNVDRRFDGILLPDEGYILTFAVRGAAKAAAQLESPRT